MTAPVSIAERLKRAEVVASPAAAGSAKITASPFRWPDPSTLPRRPWVFGRWLLRDTVSAIVAPGGVGKSSFVASMLLALASGREEVLGKTVWAGPKTVWYWNLEDGLPELEMQLSAASMLHRVGAAECADRIYLDSGPDGDGLCIAVETRDGYEIASPIVEGLVDELLARKIDVLVVDPFVSSHAVSENDNVAIDAVAKTWARVAKRANCAVVLVHHSKKLGGEKVTAESSRGASSLVSAARVTLVLNRMDANEAKHLGIAEEKERRRIFSVQDDKANRAPAEDAQWYRLASQDVGNSTGPDDPWGQYGDSVGVVVQWSPPDMFANVTANDLLAVQRMVDGGRYRKSVQATDWVGHAVAEVIGVSADAKDVTDRAKINKLLSTWFATKALIEIEGKDDKHNRRPFVAVGTWAVQDTPPTSKSGVRAGVVSGGTKLPHPTSPPLGEVVVGGGADHRTKVGENAGEGAAPRVVFPAGNRALKPILAPGESEDDPVPGWEDL